MANNPTAIITGASTGIGKALAFLLAKEGYDLGLLARRGDLLEQIKKEILHGCSDRKVVVAAVDVSKVDDCRTIIFQMKDQLGGLDLFIANAGVGGSTPGGSPCWKEAKKIIDINVTGALGSLEAAKEIMLKQKSGHLVGLSSIAAVRGLPQSSAYCMSRAAVAVYLESLRVDLKAYGIFVTSIHPGFVDTPMTEKMPNRPFLVSVEKAADEIFGAIRRKKARHYFPLVMRLVYPLLKHMPDPVYDFLMGFRKETGVFKNKEG